MTQMMFTMERPEGPRRFTCFRNEAGRLVHGEAEDRKEGSSVNNVQEDRSRRVKDAF